MSVAGYFPWVGWNATLLARTGNAYLTGVLLVALAPGLAELGGAGLGAADDAAGDGVAGAPVIAGVGVTNCGVAAADGASPAPPQPARQSASTVRAERARTGTTGPSWQKPLIRADPPSLDRLADVRPQSPSR
jgi:hypothetical protein